VDPCRAQKKYSRNASRYQSDAHCELRQLVRRHKPARQKIRKNGKRKIANVHPVVCRPIRAINVKVNLRSIRQRKITWCRSTRISASSRRRGLKQTHRAQTKR
jgi:hypothetical protein